MTKLVVSGNVSDEIKIHHSFFFITTAQNWRVLWSKLLLDICSITGRQRGFLASVQARWPTGVLKALAPAMSRSGVKPSDTA